MPHSPERATAGSAASHAEPAARSQRTGGPCGVFALLVEEHAELVRVLRAFADAPDADRRIELLPELRRTLLGHEQAEAAQVYARLRESPRTRAIAENHDEEADELDKLFREVEGQLLEGLDIELPLSDLQDALDLHIAREESEYFPLAQAALDRETSAEMAEGYSSAKREATDAL